MWKKNALEKRKIWNLRDGWQPILNHRRRWRRVRRVTRISCSPNISRESFAFHALYFFTANMFPKIQKRHPQKPIGFFFFGKWVVFGRKNVTEDVKMWFRWGQRKGKGGWRTSQARKSGQREGAVFKRNRNKNLGPLLWQMILDVFFCKNWEIMILIKLCMGMFLFGMF